MRRHPHSCGGLNFQHLHFFSDSHFMVENRMLAHEGLSGSHEIHGKDKLGNEADAV
jgi:hypothetical protein